jgi:hypothetical protein
MPLGFQLHVDVDQVCRINRENTILFLSSTLLALPGLGEQTTTSASLMQHVKSDGRVRLPGLPTKGNFMQWIWGTVKTLRKKSINRSA